jgi:hypothetical protein
MSDDMTIQADGERYVLRRNGDDVQVGRRNGNEVAWLDDVDGSLFSGAARAALDRGDTDDEALLTAVRGITQAEVERGG